MLEKLNYNAKIKPVKPLNDEMTLCKCYVLALGKNRNYSYIDESAVEHALPTIYNIPVIGHMYVDSDGNYCMGGHDVDLVRGEDGALKFHSLCVPFGTVPVQDNIHYEDIIDSNGNKITYQVADVILWTGRYPDLYKAIYNDDIYFGQSMEINVNKHEKLEDDGRYTKISDFSYSALCLLGKSDNPDKHVEPCFPESRVEPYQFSLEDEQFTKLMSEFKAELTECFQAINITKGGEQRLTIETYSSVLAEFGLSEEDLSFEVAENMNEDEFRVKCEEIVSSKNFEGEDSDTENNETVENEDVNNEENETPETEEVMPTEDVAKEEITETMETGEETSESVVAENTETVEPVAEPEVASEPEQSYSENYKFSMTYREKLEKLSNKVKEKNVLSQDTCVFYDVVDFNDDSVYIVESILTDCAIKENYFKAGYTVTDNDCLIGDFEEVTIQWLTKDEVAKLESMKAEYTELQQYRNERVEADRIQEYEAVIAEFSDLANNEEFQKVLEDKMSFSCADTLKEKCFAIRGKTMQVKPAEKSVKKYSINVENEENDVYGGFFKRFPPKRG